MIPSLAAFLVAIPLVTMVILAAVRRREEILHPVAVVAGLLSLAAATCFTTVVFSQSGGAVIPIMHRGWISSIEVYLRLGIEPVGALMIWIAAFSTSLGVIAAARDLRASKADAPAPAAHYSLLFLIEAALFGFFMARDLLLLFVCYETVLIPMFLLILRWGGQDRVKASLKFVLFTLFGSLPMLLAIVATGLISYATIGRLVFDIDLLSAVPFSASAARWLFAGLALAFLVKIPLWPLHTWLPDAHTQAPTSGSIVLAGVLLKMGTYGLAMIAIPIFPAAAREAAPVLQALALAGILLGGFASFAQKDAKRLIAYSSVSHMGFVVLGLFAFTAEGWLGAILQMAAHGVSTGALFFFVGLIYRRRHDRNLSAYGGLSTLAPGLTVWTAVSVFSSTALPGTAGFVAEVMVLYGAFCRNPLLALLAAPAVIISAAYMLKFFKAIAFGPPNIDLKHEWDGARFDEIAGMAVCGVLLIAVGLFPWATVLSSLAPTVGRILGGLPL